MTVELYNSPYSTCSQKVRMCLHEKQVSWIDHVVNLKTFEQLKPEYLAINPNGVVPSLVHDGRAVLDSSVIIEYIDEAFPGQRLSPADLVERAAMRSWMRFFEEVPTVSIRVPTFNAKMVDNTKDMDDEAYQALTARMPLRKHFYRHMDQRKGFSQSDTREALERLETTLVRMEGALTRSTWLNGATFTLADITVMPTIVRMDDLGLGHMWKSRPGVTRWYEQIKARPSFAKTFFAGTRMSAANP